MTYFNHKMNETSIFKRRTLRRTLTLNIELYTIEHLNFTQADSGY